MKNKILQLKNIFTFCLLFTVFFITPLFAQTTKSANPNDKSFRLAICDGPAALNTPATHMLSDGKGGLRVDPQWKADPNFIACDFQGLMKQVQWLITAMLTLGVFVAILGFSYAGYLYITGTPGNISKAHELFPKIGLGFVIMLSAWFIIYQVLGWLTGNSGLKALLGSP